MTAKKRTRRQRHSYSPEVARLICERLAADGASLRQICQDTSMPARSTLFVWLRQRPDFREKYKFAKWFQIQWLADDMVDIADGRANEWSERAGPDGKTVRVFDHENFRSRKRQIGEVQWRISKLRPKRYYW
jgi:hypothetical protein